MVNVFIIIVLFLFSSFKNTVTEDEDAAIPEKWKGANVCRTKWQISEVKVPEQEGRGCMGNQSRIQTHCYGNQNNNGLIDVVTYRCCWGFWHPLNFLGCLPRKKNGPRHLVATLQRMNVRMFMEAFADNQDIYMDTTSKKTIFAPKSGSHQPNTEKDSYRRFLLRHTLNYRYEIETNYTTLVAADGYPIRITLFPPLNAFEIFDGKAYANCVEILPFAKSKFARITDSSIVYKVTKSLPIIQHNLKTLLEADPDLTKFYSYMEEEGKLNILEGDDEVTVIAPKNLLMDKLFQISENINVSEKCLREGLVKASIFPNSLCSAVITQVSNLRGVIEDSYLFSDYGYIPGVDKPATNGVLLTTSSANFPYAARPPLVVLKEFHFPFYELLSIHNLIEEIYSLKSSTIFVPTKDHLKRWPSKKQSNGRLLRIHYIPYFVDHNTLQPGVMLLADSAYGRGLQIMMIKYTYNDGTNVVTVQCVSIESWKYACGSIVYEIASPLVYPENVLATLNGLYEFSRFIEALRLVESSDVTLDSDGNLHSTDELTVLAITDMSMNKIINDENLSIMDFIFKGRFCCQRVNLDDASDFFSVESLSGKPTTWSPVFGKNEVKMFYNFKSGMKFRISKCNVIATDALIHYGHIYGY